jgi:hypothetical protein
MTDCGKTITAAAHSERASRSFLRSNWKIPLARPAAA